MDNLLEQAAASPRLRMNYDLRTSATSAAGSGTGSGKALPEDSSQKMLNALLPGTVLPIHRHTKTTEVLVLLRGKMEEVFYEEGFESVWDGDSHCRDLCRKRVLSETSRVLLEAGGEVQGLSIPVGQWHGINVLEPTVILECKDGGMWRWARRIWLGRSDHAAVRAAIVYFLVDGCNALGIDPREWMEDVLLRIPGNENNRDVLRELLPDRWAKQTN